MRLKMIPIKYNLTMNNNERINPGLNDIDDDYPEEIGFDDLFMVPARINSVSPLPIINKKISHIMPLSYNYILAFNKDGILFMNIEYISGSKDSQSYYQYTGKNGFINANNIQNINIAPSTFHVSGSITTKINSYKFTLKTNDTKSLDLYKDPSMINHGRVIASGNRFDLLHDPTYLNNSHNLLGLKEQLQTNFIEPLSIKCRYVPTFKDQIFSNCIHMAKPFLFSANQYNLYLLKVCISNKIPYFENELITIPVSHVQNEAWYQSITKHQVFVITSQSLILWLNRNTNKFIDTKYYDANHTSNYISNFNPIEIPAMRRKAYIQKQYNKIAKDYIKANPKSTRWLSWKAFYDKRNIKFIIWPSVIYFILFRLSLDALNTIPYTLLVGVGVFLITDAWCTFNISQVISNKPAIIISIAVPIALIILLPLMFTVI